MLEQTAPLRLVRTPPLSTMDQRSSHCWSVDIGSETRPEGRVRALQQSKVDGNHRQHIYRLALK